MRKEQLYGALKKETVLLECTVESNPKPLAFHWTFNNSGDSSLVPSSRFNYSDFISVIKYTPITDMDYGTLACWAQNSVGDQKRPCIYQVVAAGKHCQVYILTCIYIHNYMYSSTYYMYGGGTMYKYNVSVKL